MFQGESHEAYLARVSYVAILFLFGIFYKYLSNKSYVKSLIAEWKLDRKPTRTD